MVDQILGNRTRRPAKPRLLRLAADTLAVGLFALFGIMLARQAGRIPTVWPANGVLLASLLLPGAGPRTLRLALGFLANATAILLAGFSIETALKLSTMNTVETFIAFTMMKLSFDGYTDLSNAKQLKNFAISAGLIAPVVAALLNSATRIFANNSSGEFLFASFLAHALGMVSITPVALAVMQGSIYGLLGRKRAAATLTSFAALVVLMGVVFLQSRYPLLFLVYPPLVFLTFFSDLAGGALALFLVTITAIVATVAGTGPASLMKFSTALDRIVVIQLFCAVASVLVLIVAALLAERHRVEQELIAAKNALELLASKDGLTGLANRRRLDETLEHECKLALREKTPLSLILLDVDYFKVFNDHYGHQAGDECLRRIAQELDFAARRPGDLAARYGGEELAVVLSHTDLASAIQIAETLRARIEALALAHAESRLPARVVTASLGVASLHPEDGAAGAQALIRAADRMLYEAKRNGRNRVAPAPRAVELQAASALYERAT